MGGADLQTIYLILAQVLSCWRRRSPGSVRCRHWQGRRHKSLHCGPCNCCNGPMPDPIRIAKLVTDVARCSRAEAEQYIEGGWVRVDSDVVEDPQW